MGDASHQSIRSNHHLHRNDPYDNGTNEDYDMQYWSYSNQPHSNDQVHRPESLWQAHYMEAYENELKTVHELQHLHEFGMKPPYWFGTHEEDPLTQSYNKLNPKVLVLGSNSADTHRFLSQRHANVVSRTTACIYDLREVFDRESWRETALFPYESMRTAPDTSFDENRTSGCARSYQWHAKIEVACQTFRSALVACRGCDEEADWELRNNLEDDNLANQIQRLNRMHLELCQINDLIHVADGIDLFFGYRRVWTDGKHALTDPISYRDSWAHSGPHESLLIGPLTIPGQSTLSRVQD